MGWEMSPGCDRVRQQVSAADLSSASTKDVPTRQSPAGRIDSRSSFLEPLYEVSSGRRERQAFSSIHWSQCHTSPATVRVDRLQRGAATTSCQVSYLYQSTHHAFNKLFGHPWAWLLP